jgi:signal transduction histidine kinase
MQMPRLTSGDGKESFQMVDSNSLLTTAVAAFAPKAEAKGITLKCHIPADLPSIFGDSKQLDLALRNVLANAINYTDTGEVSVQVAVNDEPANEAIQFTVRDSGIGIEAKDMPYIFDQFYRGQKVGQSNVPGMGLGLTFVKTVVELHNGRVSLESAPEKGTIFTIWLPVTAPVLS